MSSMVRVCLALVCAFLLSGASLAQPRDVGDQGTLFPTGGREQMHCFPTGTAAVPEICGNFEVRWKLSTLMGEPIANFGLVWSLTGVRILVDKRSQFYNLKSLPPAVAKAAQTSELMLYGLGLFTGENGATLAVDVDTGAPARPDGKVSFNVPGSPDWGRFIISGGSALDHRGMVAHGQTGWCAEKHRSYLTPPQARDEMRRRTKLTHLLVCPRTSANPGFLEGALQSHCETAPKAAWCEKKPEKAETPEKPDLRYGDALDKVTDKPAVQRKHAQLVDAFRREADAACSKELAPVQACLRKSCPDAAGPSEASCKSMPNRPARILGPLLTRSDSGPCNARCQREREEAREEARLERERENDTFRERVAAWDAQWSGLANQCEENKQARAAQHQCFQASERQCNPTGLTARTCLDRRMVHAPTEGAAEAVQARETTDRMRAEQRPKFLD
ncbi:hypothetical protein CAP37_20745 [Hydrogenophaga sp. IBVHS1]|nr:hypothetical protein CAP37_20745 [Hydrogenophaga sp. IBVHS1]